MPEQSVPASTPEKTAKCRICECTDNDACAGGCSWVEPNLCSTCAEMIAALHLYWFASGPSKGSDGTYQLTRLTAEVMRRLEDGRPPIAPEPFILIP